MSLVKRIGKSGAIRGVLCWIMAQYVRLVYYTGRWEVRGRDAPEAFWTQDKPFILAFWHGRLLMIPHTWSPKHPINMLISQHRDGELISRTVAHFGIKSIRGSAKKKDKAKDKGGVAALRAMTRALKNGENVGITPDGPRGPRMRASSGIVALARLTGVPIVPVTYATRRRRILGSWDRFILPFPFTRGVYIWGEAVHVDRSATPEQMDRIRLDLETHMNEITAQADRLCGGPAVEPDHPIADHPTVEDARHAH